MRIVVQRVDRVDLKADGEQGDRMEKGVLALVGLKEGDDSEKVMAYMADKLLNLRIFEDENGKMNLSAADVGASVFLVSNFTLYGDCRHGRRPGYSDGASPDAARSIYGRFLEYLRSVSCVPVHSGVFQAEMKIGCTLDGPVTLLIDSEKAF